MAIVIGLMYLAALICFILAAFRAPSRADLIAAGLALWVGTYVITAAASIHGMGQ